MIIRNSCIVFPVPWMIKLKNENSTWIRDVQLLCELSKQSSLWIRFKESTSVGHYLFIIQHQIIFIIFHSLMYFHFILYLFFLYLFSIFNILISFLFVFFSGDFYLIMTSLQIQIENVCNSWWDRRHAQHQILELRILQVILTLRRFQDWLLHDLMNIN